MQAQTVYGALHGLQVIFGYIKLEVASLVLMKHCKLINDENAYVLFGRHLARYAILTLKPEE